MGRNTQEGRGGGGEGWGGVVTSSLVIAQIICIGRVQREMGKKGLCMLAPWSREPRVLEGSTLGLGASHAALNTGEGEGGLRKENERERTRERKRVRIRE